MPLTRHDKSSDLISDRSDFDAAFRRVLGYCADLVEAGLAAAMSGDSPAGTHQARVALRRLRAAVAAFSPLIRRKALWHLQNEARDIFCTLGKLRDSDVTMKLASGRPGRASRAKANADLRAKTMRRLRKGDARHFAARLRDDLRLGKLLRRGATARALRAAPVQDFATAALRRAWRNCQSHGIEVAAMAMKKRHNLRKDLKSMRYLAEFLSPLFPALGQGAFATGLPQLQDLLGRLNDLGLADQWLPKGTIKGDGAMDDRQRLLQEAGAIWKVLASEVEPWRGA